MNKETVISQVETELHNILPDLGVSLEEVELKQEGRRWLLQVVIDKPGGVLLEDCEAVNRVLGDRLDVIDIIPESYNLEVSSPGLERELKRKQDYSRFAGEWVKVRCFAPVEGQKRFAGKLKGLENERVQVEQEDGKVIEIPLQSVARANLWFRFGQEDGRRGDR